MLTREKVLEMKPGPELDAWVELKIFGRSKSMYLKPKSYSTDIAAAWEVVEKLSPRFMQLTRRHGDLWWCEFYGGWPVEAQTAAHAICLAALLAVMDGEDEHERD